MHFNSFMPRGLCTYYFLILKKNQGLRIAPVTSSHWTCFLADKMVIWYSGYILRIKRNNVCWGPDTEHGRCSLMVTYELYTSSKDQAECHLLHKTFSLTPQAEMFPLLSRILTAFCLKWQFSMLPTGLSNLLKARDKFFLTFVSLGCGWEQVLTKCLLNALMKIMALPMASPLQYESGQASLLSL